MSTTTAMCTVFKQSVMQAQHCFNSTSATITGTVTNASNAITAMSSQSGVAIGMPVSGAGIPSGAVVSRFLSSTSIQFDGTAATSTNAGTALTFTNDSVTIALIKVSPAGTYGAASTAYSNITGSSDEVSGTGYSAGGLVMASVTPVISGTGAYINFSPNPSWTSASFSCTAGMIYNATNRGGIVGPAIGTYDFGGTQTVASGTFTVVMPVAAIGTAILQITALAAVGIGIVSTISAALSHFGGILSAVGSAAGVA